MFFQVVYSPHASKYTIANFLRIVEPTRIHPIDIPLELNYEKSNAIPSDILPNSSKFVISIPIESEWPEKNWNESYEQLQQSFAMVNEQHDSEDALSRCSDGISNETSRKNGKFPKKSFLASTSSDQSADNTEV